MGTQWLGSAIQRLCPQPGIGRGHTCVAGRRVGVAFVMDLFSRKLVGWALESYIYGWFNLGRLAYGLWAKGTLRRAGASIRTRRAICGNHVSRDSIVEFITIAPPTHQNVIRQPSSTEP
ncbi:MAG: hypothetical protein R3B95_17060 [Nitrospirales bacterium]|nr:hypothetical protein [Nitrospirales bacterium]